LATHPYIKERSLHFAPDTAIKQRPSLEVTYEPVA
jgi:hypothetical protein